jgi:hypothetical protein
MLNDNLRELIRRAWDSAWPQQRAFIRCRVVTSLPRSALAAKEA